jgi:hypothetical protein
MFMRWFETVESARTLEDEVGDLHTTKNQRIKGVQVLSQSFAKPFSHPNQDSLHSSGLLYRYKEKGPSR